MKVIQGLIVGESIVFILFIGIVFYATKFVNFFEVEFNTSMVMMMGFFCAASYESRYLSILRLKAMNDKKTAKRRVNNSFLSENTLLIKICTF